MNVLFLGNGYDLNFKLPTAYHDFLLTVDFLLSHNLEDIKTVGDVFGNTDLNSQDEVIRGSYDLYKDVYDNVELDSQILQKIVEKTKDNIWFKYFIKSFNKNVGWIDFEKEIAYVISCFDSFFCNADVCFMPGKVCKEDGNRYIIMDAFNFFIDENTNGLWAVGTRKIRSEFTIEYPLTSGHFIINNEAIKEVLLKQINDIIWVLKTYLYHFVDKISKLLFEYSKISQPDVLKNNDVVVSFNYTNTYELFDPEAQIFYIHGNVNERIVLGVNSDKNDKEESVDTLLVEFKKYFQRTYYGTDIPYLRWSRVVLDSKDGDFIHLLVMGHSLDVTDRDYIKELFGMSSKITVLYHNDTAKNQYIKNLIKIFGEDEFERIRDNKQLEFINLYSDLSDFCKERENNSTVAYNKILLSYL